LEQIYREYRDQGLQVIAIDEERDTEGAQGFIEAEGLTYLFLENGRGDEEIVRRVFGVRSFPTSFLVGPDGKIMYAHLGFQKGDEEHIEDRIRELLEGSFIGS
jgi:hypothetical protein